MKPPDPEGLPRIDVSTEELEALLEQARQEPLREDGYQKLRAAIRTLGYVTELLEKKETTLAALRELLCPASTEKTEKVLKQAGIDTGEKKPSPESASKKPKGAAAGHGRNGAAAYRGAHKVPVPHASLKAGDRMSGCAVQRQSLPAARTRRAGADQGASAAWRRPSTSWKSCAAICAGTCTRPKLRQRPARRNMTRRRSA